MIRFSRRGNEPGENDSGSVIQALLRDRGIEGPEAVRAFFAPSERGIHDPFLLPDMKEASDRIMSAVENDEHICIYGDYDVDGMCATAILLLFLDGIGANVTYRISHRDDGYGIHADAVKQLAASGVTLIITVDNGITAFDAIDKCAELGVSAIVTDHHICGEALPKCEAVVCAKRADSRYPNPNLCGAGVAFKLVQALSDLETAMEYVSLAGIATISDIVPLTGENRVLAFFALAAINEGYCPVGVTALCAEGAARREAVRERDIAFGVAPRMNAAGRIDDASIGVRVLCSESRSECDKLAARLSELNKNRQGIETAIRDSVCAAVDVGDITDKRLISLESEGWHPGVLGIVASKVAEKYCRPTVLFSRSGDILTGSARSVPGVDIHDALGRSSSLLQRFGGHCQAAGLTMDIGNYAAFTENTEKYLSEKYDFSFFVPSRYYETELDLIDVNDGLVEDLDRFAPFGEGNPEPVFCARGVKLYSLARAGAEGNHLRADAVQGGRSFPAIFFGAGDCFESLSYADTVDILYTPIKNKWKDQLTLQLKLVAVKPAAVRSPKAYIDERRSKFVGAFLNNITYNGNCEELLRSEIDREEQLKKLLDENRAGVCVLCFTPAGAERALELLKDTDVDVAFGRPATGPCAYNTLLLAPQLAGLTLSRFRRVLIFDDCGTCGIAREVQARFDGGAAARAGDCDREWYNEMADALVVDREQYKHHYLTLLSAGEGNVLTASAIAAMGRRTGHDAEQCRFVLNVFAELGFISKVSGSVLKLNRSAPFCELGNSARYAAAAAFKASRKRD